MSFMLVAPSTIATAIDTSATPLSTSGNFPARASAGPSAAVSPHLVGELAQQHRPGVPGQAVRLGCHLTGPWSHGVSFITKSAPALEVTGVS